MVCIISLHEEEVLTLVIELHFFPMIDLVRIHYDIGACRLAEDLGQADFREGLGVYNIVQNITRSYGRQLVDITDQDQAASLRNRKEQRMEERNIYHGHLIDDNSICLQRVRRIPFEHSQVLTLIPSGIGIILHSMHFQHTMDSSCLISCCF